jgi:hypothetical protein
MALRASAAALARRSLGTGAVGGETLLLARAPLGVGHRIALLDGARGQWLALGRLGRKPSRRPAVWLARALVPFLDRPPPGLLFDEGLAGAAAGGRWAWSRPLVPNNPAAEAPSGATAEVCARLPALADDLAYLELPRTWQLPAPLTDTLALFSQALLRAFAWRIPGFAHAGLRYLHANFLDARASVEDEPARRVVRLGSAPLHLVLGVSGMARSSYQLRWGDGRPFALFPSS